MLPSYAAEESPWAAAVPARPDAQFSSIIVRSLRLQGLTFLVRRRCRLFELVKLLLHRVEVALQDFVRLFVRPLLLPALGELRFELRERFGLLLDGFETLLHELNLDEAFLEGLLL